MRRMALAGALLLPAAPGAAEFFWEGLMPYVKPGVGIVIQEPECAADCPLGNGLRTGLPPRGKETGQLERTPWAPPSSGERK